MQQTIAKPDLLLEQTGLDRKAQRLIKAFRAAAATAIRHCIGEQASGGHRQPPESRMGRGR
jgi:hypothetical protein